MRLRDRGKGYTMKKPVAEFRIFGLSGLRPAAHPALWIAAIAVVAALLQSPPARGQITSQNYPPYMGPNSRNPGATSRYSPQSRFPMDDNTTYIESIRLAQLKAVRARSLFKDTDKLLELAKELNAEVGGDNAEPLGKAQLRKVSKIAKLAHSVEENMKLVFLPRLRSPSIFSSPFPSRTPNSH